MTSLSERDILRGLLGLLVGAGEAMQREVLAKELRAAPSMFSDVFDAIRRVDARVKREGVSPAVACERELRLLAGVDES